ncbi:hypothetical protein KKC65_00765 [Patescibacteria group bacterium]|nr:hypothetical protein [Patescibacteria group bacterium]
MIYKRMFFVLLFAYLVSLIVLLENEVYQALIPLAVGLFSFALASFVFRSRIISVIFFVLIFVTLCQFAVTAKKAQTDEVFRQQLKTDSVGVFVADIVHGFKRNIGITKEIKEAAIEAKNGDDYTKLENINPRYATMIVVAPIGIFFLIFRKVPRKEIKTKK